jgi:hypothetical protein
LLCRQPSRTFKNPTRLVSDVGMGVFEGIPTPAWAARLTTASNWFVEKRSSMAAVGQVDVDMGERWVRCQEIQAGLFEVRVVVVVQVVQAGYLDAVVQEFSGEVEAYEAGAPVTKIFCIFLFP